MKGEQLTQSEALEAFEYRDGNLYWKIDPKSYRVKIGDIVGAAEKHGYRRLSFRQRKYRVHQIVFLMHRGFIPREIDHIDGNPSNNRIENLREATSSQNKFNTKRNTLNTSGFKGVYWKADKKKWSAYIDVNKKRIQLGAFKNKIDAALVAIHARKTMHGEFSRIF